MKINILVCIAISLFLFPQFNFAQAPNLGTAKTFVLFTTIGAVGNTGISHLTGNVGTNSGAITGFGNVNGRMHSGDGTTAAAANDLLLAYNQLKNTVATATLAPLLGNGQVITAGVYSISSDATLNLDLILDAQGDANAVFIFKIEAPLSTNAESKVKLINGAQACNVFWKVEGLISMAAGTSMKGTLIANNAAINMSTRDTLEGRALSTSGAITVDGVLAYIPSGCGSVVLTGPMAPTLATAACYAIFSSNGPVTNTGTTNVTGDIGTNVGLTTGYDPLFVNGTIHPIPDGSTSQAATDLGNAYTYLNGLPHDIELLYPAQFGNNLVLTPHTYLLNAATTFNDSLYLNAQGNADAVFVIKINGALSTSVNSKVILMNGAQSKNVYWKVDGAVSINDNSIFKGTIVANNGAIDITTGVDLDGRALTTTGALTTASMIATIPQACNTVLPVRWTSFTGKPVHKNVLLQWSTSLETDNSFFTLERSGDGIHFSVIAVINATRVNGQPVNNYSYLDQQPLSNSYYRISQTDLRGDKNYFTIIQVKMSVPAFTAVHYVQGANIIIQTSGATPGKGTIKLYNIEGKEFSSQPIVWTNDANIFKMKKPAYQGVYLLQIESEGQKLYGQKIIILE